MEGPVRQFVLIFELMNHSWRQRSKIWSKDRFKPGRMEPGDQGQKKKKKKERSKNKVQTQNLDDSSEGNIL